MDDLFAGKKGRSLVKEIFLFGGFCGSFGRREIFDASKEGLLMFKALWINKNSSSPRGLVSFLILWPYH